MLAQLCQVSRRWESSCIKHTPREDNVWYHMNYIIGRWCSHSTRPDSLTRWETPISIMRYIILVIMLFNFKKHFDYTLLQKSVKWTIIYITPHFSSIGINYWPTINTTVEWKSHIFAIIIQVKTFLQIANRSLYVLIYEKLIISNGIWPFSPFIWQDANYYTILSVISTQQQYCLTTLPFLQQ